MINFKNNNQHLKHMKDDLNEIVWSCEEYTSIGCIT